MSKVLVEVENLIKENKRLNLKVIEQDKNIRLNLEKKFNSKLIYWVDGYKEILNNNGITDETQVSSIVSDILKHQTNFILTN